MLETAEILFKQCLRLALNCCELFVAADIVISFNNIQQIPKKSGNFSVQDKPALYHVRAIECGPSMFPLMCIS